MIKNIIFDYNGVLATINFKNMLKNFHFKDRFKVHRLITAYKKDPEIKNALNLYKSGDIDKNTLFDSVSKRYPKSAQIFPAMLQLIPECLEENKALLNVIEILHKNGIKIIMLSNSTPEIESKIQTSPLVKHFDGFVLSHKVEMRKPSEEIYKYTCNFYDLIPSETLFIDDSKRNLASAKNLGIKVMHCDNIKLIAERVSNIFFSNRLYNIHVNSKDDNDEKFDNNNSRD